MQLAYMFNDASGKPASAWIPCPSFFRHEFSSCRQYRSVAKVVFWPFPRATLTSITREFWPRVIFEQYDKKQPVWMVSVYLLASSHDLLRQLKSAFLTQYIAGKQMDISRGGSSFKWRWVQTDT